MADTPGTEIVRRPRRGGASFVRPTPPDISEINVEYGVETNLPTSTPYNPVRNGTEPAPNDPLFEIQRGEYDPELPTIKQLIKMRQLDPQARALYRLLTLPIRAALRNYTIVSPDGDKGETAFIEAMLSTPANSGGLDEPFAMVVNRMLLGLFDGCAVFEKIYHMPEFGPLKGKWTLKKLAPRPAETIAFVANQRNELWGVRQRAYQNGKYIDVPIPAERIFYYAAQEEERKFYGVSYFQSMFTAYTEKMRLSFLAMKTAARVAVPARIGTVPPTASNLQKMQFRDALSSLTFAQWVALPDGFKIDLLNEQGTFDFLGYIAYENSQMSKSLLATFFDQSQGAGPNGTAVVDFSESGDDLFILMLRSIMDDMAASINAALIPQAIDLNFGSGRYPTFSWGKLTDEQRKAVADIFKSLSTAGQQVNVTPEFMRKIEEEMARELDFQIDYEEIAERELEEQQAQEAAQQAALEAQQAGLPQDGQSADVQGGAPQDDSQSGGSLADFEKSVSGG